MAVLEHMVTKAQIGRLMKARRERLGMTQLEVAEQIPTSRPNYTNWENGKIDVAVSDLQTVAQILKVPMSYFFPADNDEWASDDGPIEAYYNGLPPETQDLVREMVKAAHMASKRAETTHGKKAE
jgi:transcriptional regulator with XRE-family HTH domain